ncbi:hypothetical protein ET445_15070 [Agromyces protaetiae]|uniref:FtsK domain-containing protein n=1 Tax=Agromyces protaetiae TaxID=2509455 RepID=A0A4P6FH24_9MICO|nr:FtsK/SpoIIIE domain-containing protein [Agromyces protaetiae]QAY74453.1 hypothetical protein ET445_15070 [Agromyces protaetiae]
MPRAVEYPNGHRPVRRRPAALVAARAPDEAKPGFPVIAVLAPVIAAGVLWAVTGSMLSLVFAALGPVVAIASMADAARQQKRRAKRATATRAAALDELRADIARRHDGERRLAWHRSGSAAEVLASTPGSGWHGAGARAPVLGRGAVASALRVGGSPADDDDRTVLAAAALLEDAPVTVAIDGGLGFVGTPDLARGAARAAVLQLAHASAPGSLEIVVPGAREWTWAAALPHTRGSARLVVTDASCGTSWAGAPALGESCARIAVAPDAGSLPPGLRTVVRIETPGRAVFDRPASPFDRAFAPALVSAREAGEWAVAAAAAAARGGLSADSIPGVVPFEELAQPDVRPFDRTSLAVSVGSGAAGAVELDLVADGIHALVAGTTGSGKSEFLLGWLAALARSRPPELVSFLLVDFKGGAAFEPLRGLPHVAGIVTDLDDVEARRAVESLRAELRHREHVLRDAGAREISALPASVVLPRLVIVVDEFQAMVERFSELAPVIADLAARGRSLGVHLVLAAQRPNGVVREQVTANCGLRVSLRVLDRGDSTAVLGTDAAAALDPERPGRAIVVKSGSAPVEFQAAYAPTAVLERLRATVRGVPARRPWLDPLPTRIAPHECAALAGEGGSAARAHEASGITDGVVFGVVDEPDRQRRSLAVWRPEADGHVLVAGVPGSGRTTTLAAVAAGFEQRHGAGTVVVAGGPRSTESDILHALVVSIDAGVSAPRLLVLDDLDSRYRAWDDEQRQAMLELVGRILRDGRALGVRVAAAISAGGSLPYGLREEFGAFVPLRHASRGDLAHAGGAGELWSADDGPGAGQWRGRRMQVVDAGALPPAPVRAVPPLEVDERPCAVVSATPAPTRPRSAARRDATRSSSSPAATPRTGPRSRSPRATRLSSWAMPTRGRRTGCSRRSSATGGASSCTAGAPSSGRSCASGAFRPCSIPVRTSAGRSRRERSAAGCGPVAAMDDPAPTKWPVQ